MTFEEWWKSAPHRAKYANEHPVYLAAREAWEAATAAEREACAKVCEDRAGSVSMFSTGKEAAANARAVQGCAAAIRART